MFKANINQSQKGANERLVDSKSTNNDIVTELRKGQGNISQGSEINVVAKKETGGDYGRIPRLNDSHGGGSLLSFDSVPSMMNKPQAAGLRMMK